MLSKKKRSTIVSIIVAKMKKKVTWTKKLMVSHGISSMEKPMPLRVSKSITRDQKLSQN